MGLLKAQAKMSKATPRLYVQTAEFKRKENDMKIFVFGSNLGGCRLPRPVDLS